MVLPEAGVARLGWRCSRRAAVVNVEIESSGTASHTAVVDLRLQDPVLKVSTDFVEMPFVDVGIALVLFFAVVVVSTAPLRLFDVLARVFWVLNNSLAESLD